MQTNGQIHLVNMDFKFQLESLQFQKSWLLGKAYYVQKFSSSFTKEMLKWRALLEKKFGIEKVE